MAEDGDAGFTLDHHKPSAQRVDPHDFRAKSLNVSPGFIIPRPLQLPNPLLPRNDFEVCVMIV